LNEKLAASKKKNKGNSKDLEENFFFSQMILTIEDRKVLDAFK